MNTTEFDWETEAKEAMTREYNWITEVVNEYHQEANKSFKIKVISLDAQAQNWYGWLKDSNGEFAEDFFRSMEILKGILGDLGRAIRGEELPADIQKMIDEERRGFGLEY